MKRLVAAIAFVCTLPLAWADPSLERYRELNAEISAIDTSLNQLELRAGIIFYDDPEFVPASYGVMTRDHAAEIYSLFLAGLTIIDAVLEDDQLTGEHKARLVERMLEKLADSMVIFMRHRENYRNPNGHVPFLTFLGNIVKEISHDLTVLFMFHGLSGESGWRGLQWGPVEQRRREELATRLLNLFRERYGNEVRQVNESSDDLRSRYFDQLHSLVDRAINMRMERDQTQFVVRGVYFFGGLLLGFFPPIDYFPERTFFSTLQSGAINASVLWFLYMVKGMTSSVATAKMWADFLGDLLTDKEIELTKRIRDKLRNAPKLKAQYVEPRIPFILNLEFKLRDGIKAYWKKVMRRKGSCNGVVVDETAAP